LPFVLASCFWHPRQKGLFHHQSFNLR
jgi:hypothetical protein